MLRKCIYLGLILAAAPTNAMHYSYQRDYQIIIPQVTVKLETNPGIFITGLSASVLAGIITGICFGALNKSTYEECHKRGYKKTSKFLCWLINPSARATILFNLATYANTLGIPFHGGLAQMIAETLDWLIYFEKIKLPYDKNPDELENKLEKSQQGTPAKAQNTSNY